MDIYIGFLLIVIVTLAVLYITEIVSNSKKAEKIIELENDIKNHEKYKLSLEYKLRDVRKECTGLDDQLKAAKHAISEMHEHIVKIEDKAYQHKIIKFQNPDKHSSIESAIRTPPEQHLCHGFKEIVFEQRIAISACELERLRHNPADNHYLTSSLVNNIQYEFNDKTIRSIREVILKHILPDLAPGYWKLDPINPSKVLLNKINDRFEIDHVLRNKFENE